MIVCDYCMGGAGQCACRVEFVSDTRMRVWAPVVWFHVSQPGVLTRLTPA